MLHRPVIFTVALALLAGEAITAAAAGEQAVRKRLEAMFEGEEITSVREAPVAGIFEVMLGASLFYVSEDGRYALRGDLIDLEERRNISDARRADARKEVFAGIDPKDLVTFAPAPAARRATLYVYTDVDCGYCRKLHDEVPTLNAAGIAVEYLAFPRAGVQSESYDKIAAVWCASDRREAMTAAKAGKPVDAPSCDNPVAAQFELGQAMGVSGTPAVYTKDGQQLGGYVPAERLIKMLDEGKI
ncbi:MAG: DsbC family protein [Gammaproteobacteria bacterium]